MCDFFKGFICFGMVGGVAWLAAPRVWGSYPTRGIIVGFILCLYKFIVCDEKNPWQPFRKKQIIMGTFQPDENTIPIS